MSHQEYGGGRSENLWTYKREVTPQTYIRDLPPKMLYDMAAELDHVTTGTSWKELAMKIPKSRFDPTPKFTQSNIRTIEATAAHRSPTISILQAWSVTNATAYDLVDLLHHLKLPRLADEILPTTPPPYEEVHMQPVPSEPVSVLLPIKVPLSPPFLPPRIGRIPQESLDESSTYCPSLPSKPDPPSSTFDSVSLKNIDINASLELPSFPYTSLQELTQNFNESYKLGEGAFGSVFHGDISDSLSQSIKSSSISFNSDKIAIKRLKVELPDLVLAVKEQFKKEVEIISGIDHENILPLVGYSCDGPELCLVYHFMLNGSLSSILQKCRERKGELTILQRIDISVGSATGIEYLHSKNLVHRDIKSSNILLDVYKKPRISDFGLIRSIHPTLDKTSTVTSQAIGSPVYMAPEAYTGEISPALDVYGFGVVLYELLTGLAVLDDDRNPRGLVTYVEDNCDETEESELIRIADKNAGIWDVGIIRKFHGIASNCTEHRRKKRPTISVVLTELKHLLSML